MNIQLVMLLLAMQILMVTTIKFCKGIVKFDGKFYEKHYLAQGTVSKPFCMKFFSGKIIFSEDTEPLGHTETYMLEPNSGELIEIPTAADAVAIGIVNGTAYIAKDNGLHVLDSKTLRLNPSPITEPLLILYTKNDELFYTDHLKSAVFLYKDGISSKIKDFEDRQISDLVLDNMNNVFYNNISGVYFLNVKKNKTYEIALETADGEVKDVISSLLGLIYDGHNDKVYATSGYGVFAVNKNDWTMKRISLKIMYDIIFDEENYLIYSDEESIVRLVATNRTC